MAAGRKKFTASAATRVPEETSLERLAEISTNLRDLLRIGNRPLPRVNPFRGRADNRSWQTFIREVNDAANMARWSEADLLTLLPSWLTGEARSIYDGLSATKKGDWKGLCVEMASKMSVGDTAALQRQALSRRQREGESVPEFGEDVRLLVARAFVDAQRYTNDQRETMAVNIFRNGLRPNLRAFVLRSVKPASLSEAIARAIEEENLQRELARDSLNDRYFDQLTELSGRVNVLQAEAQRGRWQRPPPRPFPPRPRWQPRPFVPRPPFRRPFGPPRRPFFTPLPPQSMNQRMMGGRDGRNGGGRAPRGGYRINALSEASGETERAETSNGTSWNAQAGSTQYLPLICILAIIAALVPSGQALPETLNLCAYPLYREVRPIPAVKNCTPPTSKQAEEIIDVAVWLPRADPFRFKAYYCSRVKRSICTEAYLTVFGRSKAKQANVYSPINGSDCWQLLNTRELEGKHLVRQGLKDYSTQTTLTYDYGWWGEDCFVAEDFEIEVRTVGTMDGSSLMAGELDTGDCKLEERECSLTQGILVWPSQSKELACRYLKKGDYTAVYADTHVVVEALQASFVVGQPYVSPSEEGCYPTYVYSATNDALISFFNRPVLQQYRRWRREATTLVTARRWTGDQYTTPTTPATTQRIRTTKTTRSLPTTPAGTTSPSWLTTTTTRTSSPAPSISSTPSTLTARSTSSTPSVFEEAPTTRLLSYAELLQRARVITTAPSVVEAEPEEEGPEQWNDDDMVGDGVSTISPYIAGPVVSDLVGRSVKKQGMKGRREGSIVEEHPVRTITPSSAEENNQANRNLNARVQFLEDRTQERAHEEFSRIYTDLCELENGDVRALLELLSRDATAAMRLYLQRNNISARLMGEVVEVYECTPVPTRETTIYWDKRINETCFDLIPVRYKEEVYFLKQVGQPDLQTTAKEVACTSITELPIYFDPNENIYRTTEGKVRVEEWPDLMTYSPGRERIVFNATTIYQSDTRELAAKVEFLTGHKTKPLYDRQRLAPGTRNGPGPMEKLKGLGDAVVTRVGEATAQTVGWFEEHKKKLALAIALFGVVAALLLLLMIGTYLGPCLTALATMGGVLRSGTRAVRAGTRLLGRTSTAQVNAVHFPTAPEEELVIDGFRMHTFLPPSCCLFTPNSPAKLAETEVLVNDVPIVGLLDGGSSVTYARLSTIRDLGLEEALKSPSIPGATAVNYSPVSFIGEVPVTMNMAGLVVEIPVHVSRDEDCQMGLLLGADFELKINQLGYVLGVNRLTRRVWLRAAEDVEKLPGPEVAMVNALSHLDDSLFERPDGRCIVRVEETVELPARSDTFIWGIIEGEFEQNVPVLMKDEAGGLNDGVVIGKTVSCPGQTHRIPLRILNAGVADVVLYKNKRLGKAEPLSDDYEVSEIVPPAHLNGVVASTSPYVPPELRLEEKLPVYPDASCSLLDGLKLDDAAISAEGKETLRALVLEFADAFVGPDGVIGHYRGPYKHHIHLIDESKVVRMRPYPVPHALRPEVMRQIEDMLRQGIIRESNSPFCSPIILVKKADKRSYRFVVDYRALNANTKRETYILPLISDILDEIGTKTLFSTFDLAAGFHQVEVAEESRHRTAFGCFMGAYEFVRMPFGVAGGPKTLQDLMNTFRRQLSSKCLVYLDDVIIGSEGEREHLADLREFFALMKANGMKLKLEKCAFAKKEVRYLGYLISEQGIRIDPKNVECVKKFRVPESLRELRSLIGAFGHFRRFIPHYAEIMSPLYELTKHEDVKKGWRPIHQTAFDRLKRALVSPPTLASPQIGESFRVDTDASKIALGACLLQKDKNGQFRPVQYASRKLNKHEKNYTTMELEALAIVFALRSFRMYLEGSGTTDVYTDNSALCTTLKGKELSGRLARFQMAIQDYDYKVIHRSGKSNTFCDYLSRWPGDTNDDEEGDGATPVVATVRVEEEEEEEEEESRSPRERLKKAITNDPIFRKLVRQVQLNWRGEEDEKIPEELAPYYSLRHELEYRAGVLERDGRLVIPSCLREEVLSLLHRSHSGMKRMQSRARRCFWWPRMSADIEAKAATCEVCGELARSALKVPLHPWPEAKFAWERIHIDFAGPFVGAMWMVIVDAHSRYPFVLRMSSTTAEATVDAGRTVHDVWGASEPSVRQWSPIHSGAF